MRLWAITRKDQKIRRNLTVPLRSAAFDDVAEAMDEALRQLDLSRPMILEKHRRELAQYGKMIFLPGDFIDSVSFDILEAEILFDEERVRKSKDPRNDFGF